MSHTQSRYLIHLSSFNHGSSFSFSIFLFRVYNYHLNEETLMTTADNLFYVEYESYKLCST